MSPEHLTAGELAYELACWKDIENQETSWSKSGPRVRLTDAPPDRLHKGSQETRYKEAYF